MKSAHAAFSSMTFCDKLPMFNEALLQVAGDTENFTIDQPWYGNHAVKFARWQHPATWRCMTFAVPSITCFLLVFCLYVFCLIFVLLSGVYVCIHLGPIAPTILFNPLEYRGNHYKYDFI